MGREDLGKSRNRFITLFSTWIGIGINFIYSNIFKVLPTYTAMLQTIYVSINFSRNVNRPWALLI